MDKGIEGADASHRKNRFYRSQRLNYHLIDTGVILTAGPKLTIAVLMFAATSAAQAPTGGRAGAPPPRTAKASALYDITGDWVAVVTEDWRYRIMTPRKGDYVGVALNQEGRKLADSWDPAKDEAAGDQCKGYAAPSLMRLPGRIRLSWQDEQTLKLESDAGEQTRLFHFDASEAPGSPWQGVSKANWEIVPASRGAAPIGSLKVVTNRMKAGYLRKNGVPLSANAVLTEYFDKVNEPNGDSYLLITTTVEDPTYLAQSFLATSHFRKLPDGRGWKVSPCSAR
jgi:hypothetical protein